MAQIPKNLKDGYRESLRPTGDDHQWRVAVTSDGNPLDIALTQTPTTATIFNVLAATAGTEYSQALPANTKGFIIRSRNRSNLQLAYTSGQTGITYLTIPAGASYEDSNLYTAQTIYFQASKNAETIEIIAYT